MKSGSEFLFWLILFGEIAAAGLLYWIVRMVRDLHRAKREIIRLKVERNRLEKLLHHRSESAYKPRLVWAR